VTNNSSVVVDASFVVKLCVPEAGSDAAYTLNREWIESGTSRAAPSLIDYEIVSALNKKLVTGLLSDDEADAALEALFTEALELVDTADLHRSALFLSRQLGLRSSYDAHYLAAATEMDCEFWTADERLYNAVRERFPMIRWLGNAAQTRPEDKPDEDR